MLKFTEFLMEKAPPSKEAEKWIKDNKAKFKDQYGDDWEKVLYAKAWKMFGEKDEDDPCWDGYEQYGTKKKDGKEVPNCVPEEKEEDEPEEEMNEAEYEGKKVKLDEPFRLGDGDDKKFGVYVKNDKGNVVQVKFGSADMEIKRDDDEARKNFRARFKCDQQKDKTSAAYWSCKMWQKGKSVSDMLESEAPTNTTSGVANPDGAPLFKKSKFAGYPCVEVDGSTYVKCSRGKGKKPYARWKQYVEDDDLETFVKKNYHKEKRLLMKNRDTGAMTFIK